MRRSCNPMRMAKRICDPALLLLLLISGLFHFAFLNWGTPNRERSLLVFRDENRIRDLTPRMVQAHDEIYEWTQNPEEARPSITRVGTQPSVVVYPPTTASRPKDIPLKMIHSLRSYLLRSSDPDEQQTLSALANMNPRKGDLDPNEYKYGGCYLYGLALFLGTVYELGLVTLRSDLNYYLMRPEPLAAIFTVCRLFGALFAVATAALLYAWAGKRWNRAVGWTAGFLYALSPEVIAYGHISKPNIYSAFWTLLALSRWDRFLERNQEQGSEKGIRREPFLIGLLFGFAVGSFVVSAASLLIAGLWLFFRDVGDWKSKAKIFMWVLLGTWCGFILTNPYYLFAWRRISDQYFEHLSGKGWGYGAAGLQKLVEVLQALPATYGIIGMVGLGIGFCLGVIRRDGFTLSCSLAYLLIALFMGHTRFLIPLLPFTCVIAALGWFYVLEKVPRAPARVLLLVIGICVVLLQGIQVLAAYGWDNAYRNEVGRWIHSHIPAGSSIGLVGKEPLIWHTPPFAFEQYKLVGFYSLNEQNLAEYAPEWLIAQPYSSSGFWEDTSPPPIPSARYTLAQTFHKPILWGWWKAGNPSYPFACQPVFIWKKHEKTPDR